MDIAVTGMGLWAPCGRSVGEALDALWSHRSAVAALPAVEAYGLSALAGASCAEVEAIDGIAPHLVRGIDRVSLFSLAAASQALAQAEKAGALERAEVPVVWGCSIGGTSTLNEAYQDLLARQKRRVRPTTIPYAMPSAAAFHIAHHLGVRGPSMTVSVACASSALAIVQGCRMIATGEAEQVVVGGVESMSEPAYLRAWQAAQAVCEVEPENPSASCRPFSAARHGFAIGEGAAALVLESAESARRRGVPTLGWVRGWGHTTDAAHISRPDQAAQVAAMRRAVAHAGWTPDDIAYVNAHGTATPAGDMSEGLAVTEVFGDAAPRVAVSSTKAMSGHLLGGAGALEAIVTLESLSAGTLPGNPHLGDPDPALAALYLPREPVRLAAGQRRIGLSNSFAFGGVNAVLALEGAA